MSTFYKIGEIAALYGISTDILRYYEELGILVPRRAPNGYRVYRTETRNVPILKTEASAKPWSCSKRKCM